MVPKVRTSLRPRRRARRASLTRSITTLARLGLAMNEQLGGNLWRGVLQSAPQHHRRAAMGEGDWVAGWAPGPAGGRRYHLYKPSGVHASECLPLLVMLHGCGQDAQGFAASTRMNRLAERERAFVLYPEQDVHANPQRCWNWFSTGSGQAGREAATIMAAIDQVCRLYPADPDRIAVAGLSAGASLAALLGAAYPERFRAVVMHSGVGPGLADSTANAWQAMQGRGRPPTPPIAAATWPPLLVLHGTKDAIVSARNAHWVAEHWAQALGAAAAPVRRVQRGQRYAMEITDYKVRGRVAARCCEVDGLGHAWSGGDARHPHGDARGPDATRLVWSFVNGCWD